MKDFSPFEERIGIVFNNKKLLAQAFTHRSFLNENRGLVQEHNERLEFLGDAVLELVVTHFLFEKYKDKPEGELTAVRAAMVNTLTISEAGKKLGMNEFMLLSRGEAKDTGRARQFILANAFEALIGAIYLDKGYEIAEKFIADALFGLADIIVRKRLWQDPKSRFQEQAQERVSITPTYRVLSEEGPDHDKNFTVGVFLEDTLVEKGIGRSKQEAEQAAAEKALTKKSWS